MLEKIALLETRPKGQPPWFNVSRSSKLFPEKKTFPPPSFFSPHTLTTVTTRTPPANTSPSSEVFFQDDEVMSSLPPLAITSSPVIIKDDACRQLGHRKASQRGQERLLSDGMCHRHCDPSVSDCLGVANLLVEVGSHSPKCEITCS